MTTYVVDVPDVVARALDRVARRFGVSSEALIAEAIRALPEFQEEMSHQMAIVESVTHSASMTGDGNVRT
jgi:predicted transcriptional regulator